MFYHYKTYKNFDHSYELDENWYFHICHLWWLLSNSWDAMETKQLRDSPVPLLLFLLLSCTGSSGPLISSGCGKAKFGEKRAALRWLSDLAEEIRGTGGEEGSRTFLLSGSEQLDQLHQLA